MGEVAADADALLGSIDGGGGGGAGAVFVFHLLLNPGADGLGLGVAGFGPGGDFLGHLEQEVGLAAAAGEEVLEDVVGQVLREGVGGRVVDGDFVGGGDLAGGADGGGAGLQDDAAAVVAEDVGEVAVGGERIYGDLGVGDGLAVAALGQEHEEGRGWVPGSRSSFHSRRLKSCRARASHRWREFGECGDDL